MTRSHLRLARGVLPLALLALAGCDAGSDPARSTAYQPPPQHEQLPEKPSEPPAQGPRQPPDYRAQSLYHGPEPRPGPPILYWDPPAAPQLENTGIWQAPPILISGASAYRGGEFLYQDYLYDDSGANGVLPDPNNPRGDAGTFSGFSGTYAYPSDAVYADNAADLVELRVKPHGNETAFRVTLNSLYDPERVAFSIAIGDSREPRAFPYGANVRAPAELFLTVRGEEATLRRADDQRLVGRPRVTVDLERRQFEVRVPRRSWDPGHERVRLAAGVGLWDAANERYLLPRRFATGSRPGGAGLLLRPPAFFNVAFRFDEPDSAWRDSAQAEALARGDISRFYAMVDFDKLQRRVNDDMLGRPTGVPRHGAKNRIVASHFESRQGTDFATGCGSSDGCRGGLRGQLQPYTVYVPEQSPGEAGYGLTLLLHSLGGNHNQYLGSRNQSQLGDRGDGHLVVTPAGRGPDGWYVEYAGADSFEVWADVARHYRLDPDRTAITGYSMGGYGTFRYTTRYPDLFGAAHTVVGPPALGIWVPPLEPTGGAVSNSHDQLEGVRNIPFMMWVAAADELVPYLGTRRQAERFDALGYRYQFHTFTLDEHLTLALNDEYGASAEFLGEARVQRDPRRVSYVLNPGMDFPRAGIVGDSAYWLSGLTLRDEARGRGELDAISHGFAVGEPPVLARDYGAGSLDGGSLGPRPYVSEGRRWGEPPETEPVDRLELTLRNLATVKVHVERARLSCDAELEVDSDGPVEVVLVGCGRSVSL